MRNKIIKFEIQNFLGDENVILNFQQPENIYIGENGLGKTTILNIIFYTITLNFEELLKYNFKKIIITMNNNESISFLKEDLIVNNLIQTQKKTSKTFNNTKFNSVKNSLEEFDSEYNNYVKLKFLLDNNKKEISNLDLSSKNYASKIKSISKFSNNIKKMMNGIDVLYFPTSRQIEEDIAKIHVDDLYSYQQEIIKEPRILSKHGEFIQFRMSDVDQVIKNLLEKIKQLSINSFNEMTGVLLNQYVESDIKVEKPVDFSKMEIILNRIGGKISNNSKIKILYLIRTEEIYSEKNAYLLNLLVNLINSYKKQEEIDIRIKKFVEVCNNYLVNKRYFYEESNVTLNVVSNRNNENISLENLSSGEKQIISTFSKIYLEERKEVIILFDEPELSLSLVWQERYLPDILASGKCNLLVAVTHSPFIFETNPLFDISEAISDSIININD